MPESTAASPAWRARARDRSLAGARQRADDQVTRLVAAAQEMVNANDDFTVPSLVAKVGMSTKTFYRHFASRDELLFAVMEEELAVGARAVERAVAAEADPADRLRTFVRAYLGLPRGYRSAEVRRARIQEGQRLRAVDPERSAEASAPLGRVLERIIDDLLAAGLIHDLDVGLTTRSLLHLLNGHLVDLAYATSGTDPDVLTEHAVRICSGALGLPPEPVSRRGR